MLAYVDVLGFRCHMTRPEERLADLIRENVHLMLEDAPGSDGYSLRRPDAG